MTPPAARPASAAEESPPLLASSEADCDWASERPYESCGEVKACRPAASKDAVELPEELAAAPPFPTRKSSASAGKRSSLGARDESRDEPRLLAGADSPEAT